MQKSFLCYDINIKSYDIVKNIPEISRVFICKTWVPLLRFWKMSAVGWNSRCWIYSGMTFDRILFDSRIQLGYLCEELLKVSTIFPRKGSMYITFLLDWKLRCIQHSRREKIYQLFFQTSASNCSKHSVHRQKQNKQNPHGLQGSQQSLTEPLFPCCEVGSKLLSWQSLRDNPQQCCCILFGVLVQGKQEDVLQLLFFKHGLFIFSISLQEMSNLVKMKGTREMLTEQIYRMLIWRIHLRFIFATLETDQLIFSPGWVLVHTK